MAVVIGAGSTVVSAQFPNGGISSVQFGTNPQVDRLYQLGSFAPYDTTITRTDTLSLTVYGSRPDGTGGSLPFLVSPSTSCIDSTPTLITVNPASCIAALIPFEKEYFLNSYSYSKDALGHGQETWSYTSKPQLDNYSGNIVMLRGNAEGTVNSGPEVMAVEDMGVIIDPIASNDALNVPITGETGSIPAGTPGLGTYDTQRHVIATTVGASRGRGPVVDGLVGEASIAIPITPVFV